MGTAEVMRLLVDMAWENPTNCLTLHNHQRLQEEAAKIGIPAFDWDHHIGDDLDRIRTIMPIHKPVDTGLIGQEWSLIGLLVYRRHLPELQQCFAFMDHQKPSLWPRLRDPETMPVTEKFLQPRSWMQPLGQWIPAFKDAEGQVHDAMDLCADTASSHYFGLLARIFSHAPADEPHVKAGYLARQAARAYDIFVRDIELDTDITAESARVVGEALLHGASMTQSAWSGHDLLDNQRPFCVTERPVRELAYTLTVSSNNDDAQRANALKRLREEGHDTVIFHKDDAHRLRTERPYALPLHISVRACHLHCVRELLNAGADTSARVFDGADPSRDLGKTAHDLLRLNSDDSVEISGMIRSYEARQAAMDAITNMTLDGFHLMRLPIFRMPSLD